MNALDVIRAEHRSLAAVLYTLQALARGARAGRFALDFPLLRLIVEYLDSFHQRYHHPKEDRYLFAALRARTTEGGDTLAALEREHAEGDGRLAQLREAIERTQVRLLDVDALAAEVDRYADFHWRHMRIEEDRIMPLAARTLSGEDWASIDAAFANHEDPLFGAAEREHYRRLLAAIAEHAPPPLGGGARI
jgi:hemerythrin-like domain-containing protein